MFLHFLGYKTAHDMPCSINIGFVQFEFLMGDHADGAVPGSNPGGVGHRDFLMDTYRTMCPGVNSASKNEYQGFPWG